MDIGDRAKGKEEAMLSWIDRLRGKTSSPMPSSQHPYFRATSEEVEAGPGECWHHAMPLPDGRRMKSTTMPSAGVQELMWEALQHIDLDGKSVLDIGAADGLVGYDRLHGQTGLQGNVQLHEHTAFDGRKLLLSL